MYIISQKLLSPTNYFFFLKISLLLVVILFIIKYIKKMFSWLWKKETETLDEGRQLEIWIENVLQKDPQNSRDKINETISKFEN